ncbi:MULTISPECIES: hypothetical protein [Enterobacteriaceae]|nr:MULTISPECIES: hypothetical protein [Enterobacteriaceae]EEQ0113564.1 hypothetical protein [Salmonella enterica]EET1434490.1 hypothetical protein [Escherichia coli]EFM5365763.1 hypothetical protein [Escherichia coli]EGH5610684.1 hypothetical protein [Escherichia coli]EGK7500114.1 hypothetical protein [Escherichia coli]
MVRKYIGERNGKYVFQRGNEQFERNWKPQSHSRPQTPSQLKAEMLALER